MPANRFAEFKITRLDNPSVTDIRSLGGCERKLTATVVGDFRLHGVEFTARPK